MASLHITEFSDLAATEQSDSVAVPAFDSLNAAQAVAIGAGSVQSTAFYQVVATSAKRSTKWVVLNAGAVCSVAFGTNPTAVADSGSIFLNAGQQMLVGVPADQAYKLAVIQAVA